VLVEIVRVVTQDLRLTCFDQCIHVLTNSHYLLNTIAGRALTFYKTVPGSVVQLTYSDILGFYIAGNGATWGVRWRLNIDNVYYSRPFNSHTDNYYGWRITPCTLQYFFDSIPAGAHTAYVEWYSPYGYSYISDGKQRSVQYRWYI
jgi:hypothetical protein